ISSSDWKTTDFIEFTSFTLDGSRQSITFSAPWYANDRREWIIKLAISGGARSNWQTFRVCANSDAQTIQQSSGRIALTASDANILQNSFDLLVVSGVNLQLKARADDTGSGPTSVKLQMYPDESVSPVGM